MNIEGRWVVEEGKLPEEYITIRKATASDTGLIMEFLPGGALDHYVQGDGRQCGMGDLFTKKGEWRQTGDKIEIGWEGGYMGMVSLKYELHYAIDLSANPKIVLRRENPYSILEKSA